MQSFKRNKLCSYNVVKPNVKLNKESLLIYCFFPLFLSTVLDCLWIQGNLECFDTPGFVFNRTVSSQLTVLIPRAFPNMTGEYYCKLSDSTGLEIRHCQLSLIPGNLKKIQNFLLPRIFHSLVAARDRETRTINKLMNK